MCKLRDNDDPHGQQSRHLFLIKKYGAMIASFETNKWECEILGLIDDKPHKNKFLFH